MGTIIDLVVKWLVPFVCGGIAAGCMTYIKMRRAKDRAVESGVQCLLRAEIIRSHDKYVGRHCCPIHIKEAIRREYDAYTRLGGNDVATKMYREILELPENDPGGKERAKA